MLSAPRRVRERDGSVTAVPAAPGARIHGGAIVCAGADGLAVPGRAGAGLAFLGIADQSPAGNVALVRRNADFLLRSAPGDPIAASSLGRPCYVFDDEFVAASDGGGARSPAGIVTGIEPGGYAWVRAEAAPGPAAEPAEPAEPEPALRKIYSGARTGTGTDRTGAPLDGADATLVLPSAPGAMIVRAGWSLYNNSGAEIQSGWSEGLYAGGDTHVYATFGNGSWSEFSNVGVLSGSVSTVSVGLVTDTYQWRYAWTLEFDPETRTISWEFAGTGKAIKGRAPVVRDLLIMGG